MKRFTQTKLKGFILSYVITAMAMISIAIAMLASFQSSRGSDEIRNAELDRMMQAVVLLDAGIKSCGKCGGSVGPYTGATGVASAGFVPAIYDGSNFLASSGIVASMACPNITNGGIPASARYVWENVLTGTNSASKSVFGKRPPQLFLFDIDYSLNFASGKVASASFIFKAKNNAENTQDLYSRFRSRKDNNFIGVDLSVSYSSRSIVLNYTNDYITRNMKCE
jgi:hypothetical protein